MLITYFVGVRIFVGHSHFLPIIGTFIQSTQIFHTFVIGLHTDTQPFGTHFSHCTQ